MIKRKKKFGPLQIIILLFLMTALFARIIQKGGLRKTYQLVKKKRSLKKSQSKMK